MWELMKVSERDVPRVEEVLRDGYEPFATATDLVGWVTVWFRREVTTVEIPDKQTKPKPRRSRKTTTTAKG